MKKIVKFTVEKETKNTIRYAEQPEAGTPPVIGTLYVQKWAVAGAKTLTVTIETPA